MTEKANSFKLAIIQNQVGNDKQNNIDHMRKLIIQAADQGAQIIALPEMFNCPYDGSLFRAYAESYPEGPTLQMLSEVALTKNVYVFGGSIPENVQGDIYNTCFIFGPNGKLINKFSKAHLFDVELSQGLSFRESSTLKRGEKITVIETEFGKIGVAICYDIRFPEMIRAITSKGADLVIVPAAFNMITGPIHWETTLRARAIDNQVFIAAAAPARDEAAAYVAYGHSLVTGPWGNVIRQLDEKEGILFCTIDFTEVQRVRREFPLLKHIRYDLYKQ